jgi:hypothetical protein
MKQKGHERSSASFRFGFAVARNGSYEERGSANFERLFQVSCCTTLARETATLDILTPYFFLTDLGRGCRVGTPARQLFADRDRYVCRRACDQASPVITTRTSPVYAPRRREYLASCLRKFLI